MLPAPSVITRSPVAQLGHEHVRAPASRSAHEVARARWPRARIASASSAASTPGIFSSPARVDLRQHEHGRRRGRRGELVEEVARARVAVRLEDDHDAARVELARGRERRADLGRVVAVVVDDADPGRAALRLEAALDAAEALERVGGGAERHVDARAPPRARRARSARCAGPASGSRTSPERVAAAAHAEAHRRALAADLASRRSRPATESP